LNLSEILVRRVCPPEKLQFQQLMQEYHYLGALPKISETLWYITVNLFYHGNLLP
jgi:hypothetical protein